MEKRRTGAGDAGARRRATKIVATIGTNAEAPGALGKLLRAGVDVVRINAAHARPGEIRRRVAVVRAVEEALRRPVGVLVDLGGPKIRLGSVAAGTVWRAGDRVDVVPGDVEGDGRRVGVTYPALLADVRAGHEVRIDDGRLRLVVESRTAAGLRARVLVGGALKTRAGVNFPDSALSAPALTPKDRRDLAEGLAAGVDLVGLSFVRSAAHVEALRRLLARVPAERRPWIVAKIERREALGELDAIAAATDVLMVARGDLGVEIGLASVPRAQRQILEAGRVHSVPVIVATQMLESMVESPTPTRAEVSDVAGAVHDGADAVMLSGETAVGAWPVEAVTVMAEIALKAEVADEDGPPPLPDRPTEDFGLVVSHAARRAALASRARAVAVFTETGRTVRLVSKEGLEVPILAFATAVEVRRRLAVLRNVRSFPIPRVRTVEAMLKAGNRVLGRLPELQAGTIVEVSGTSSSEGATNTLRLRRLGTAGARGVSRPRRRG